MHFDDYLKLTGEVGNIEEVLSSIVYVKGLPNLKPNEIVMFENESFGQTISISKDKSEVLLLSHSDVKTGEKVARTGKTLSIPISDHILGNIIDPLGNSLEGKNIKADTFYEIDTTPPPMSEREIVTHPTETGVALVDLLLPLGAGQRELVIGDRKTGKTQFFVRTILNQTKKGSICIYASIGKKIVEINQIIDELRKRGIDKQTIVVATSAADAPGLIFITPYTAMTIAEYFKNKGKNVIVILDDLTNHAIYYREISLLAGRFPGRNSYPGDIFYLHSKLLERAGNFKKASITCFPVAESILGDMSGYIQTNLMSITDGHIFFDSELFNLGRRPAINPFLSVTRVGQQAQSFLLRDLSRQLSSFLVSLERLRDFGHFGAELSEEIIQKLKLGDRILDFFNQPVDVMPINISILVVGMLWIGSWRDQEGNVMRSKIKKMVEDYFKIESFRKGLDTLMSEKISFQEFLNKIREGNYGQQNYY